MIQFPESTYFGKRVPKESFYQRLDMNSTIKRAFIDDIDQIVWQNKLSPDTLNIGSGARVLEIEVFYIYLKHKDYNPKLIEVIEKAIPKHLLFVLIFQEEKKLLINYKEESDHHKGQFKIVETYASDWSQSAEIMLSLDGLNIDQIYDGFIRQIAGSRIAAAEEEIKHSVEKAQTIAKLEMKIAALETKKRKEKQFNKQVEISNEIKRLKSLICNQEL